MAVTASISQPTLYSVTASVSGTTCTLTASTGTTLPTFSQGAVFYIKSDNASDSINPAIAGNFFTTAAATTSTTITYTIPSGSATPVGKLSISSPLATCTLTGVQVPIIAGESFLVVSDNTQDSSNGAVGAFVADSATATTVTYSVPTGTVIPDGNLTAVYGFAGYVTVTTSSAHGFNAGDVVSIQNTTSTSSLNGTFVIQSVPATTTFTLAVDGYAYGYGKGGTVTRINAGLDTDILNFTETTFIAEGGTLNPPTDIGKIVTMNFVPLQDSATGQGDLVVLCDRGATSMAVSVERSQWSQTPGFQRVLYSNIGAVSDSTVIVNGDMFFRSLDGNGIRSYRSARAEFAGYGQVPMSAEVDPILMQDTSWLLNHVSFAHHNDRLLMTCLPVQTFPQNRVDNPTVSGGQTSYLGTWNTSPAQTVYKGLVALDFRSVANGHLSGSAKPSYEGVWTGQSFLKVLSGIDSGVKRAFVITLNRGDAPLPATQGFGIWEIVEDADSDIGTQGIIPITSTLITRAYNFNQVMALKKLLRLDLWFDSISNGTLNAYVNYRPDDWPYWVPWMVDSTGAPLAITRTFNTTSKTLDASGKLFNLYPGYAPQIRLPAPIPPVTGADANANTMSLKPMPLGYDFNFKLSWTGHARLGRFLVHGLEIVEPVGGASI